MLNKICQKDGIAPGQHRAQARAGGAAARHRRAACRATAAPRLHGTADRRAGRATGATIAFDAIGGGTLAGQILQCMEAAINRAPRSTAATAPTCTSRSTCTACLDRGPTEITRTLRHGLGHRRLAAVPVPAEDRAAADAQALRERVAAELKTTFASHYGQRATGTKFLINPNRGL
jgi:NADPH2:quinone reductase